MFLCFTRDALVCMADDTLVPIADVKKGDYVYTVFPNDNAPGLVTDVLVHEVPDSGEEVEVGVVHTEYGDLVGTPSHPIYFHDQWMELKDALEFH